MHVAIFQVLLWNAVVAAHGAPVMDLTVLPEEQVVRYGQAGPSVEMEGGQEQHIEVASTDGATFLYVRTWGNPKSTPVLFVHGGPGNAIADYKEVNKAFFDPDAFFVVEVDQRGTGHSRPSVRESTSAMQHYLDISLSQMSADFEVVRHALDIEQWLVFGGSWGSTLGLYYATSFPERCLGLILRGIFLHTEAEFDATYKRKSFEDLPIRDIGLTREEEEVSTALTEQQQSLLLQRFDIFFEVAQQENSSLNANDAKGIVETYHKMILQGSRHAIWNWHVFENNLMEEEGSEDILDPKSIKEEEFPVAQSVAFFETHLFLKGTFEQPEDLLEAARKLASSVTTWLVQGLGDIVCPSRFARDLASAMQDSGSLSESRTRFVDAGHRASADGVKVALQASIQEFLEYHQVRLGAQELLETLRAGEL